ncbi:hypothetical protein [Candidatus Enterovibrio altilux]|uniref:hypothetical protein n=1 Tax=Candidatus Enterovibrio altilux TaxID=1927128 RepID=UPI001F42ABA3|nr:hypothetical protein [Candidatus Enterovibrio luxaltus]
MTDCEVILNLLKQTRRKINEISGNDIYVRTLDNVMKLAILNERLHLFNQKKK